MPKNPYGGPVPQHEEYAITGKANQDENFGVLQHDHKNNPFKEGNVHRKPALRDGKRGIPKHDGGFHHLPDHGPVNKSMAD